MRVIALLKCLLFVIFMIVIGSAAGRLMQWTLMICFSILFCYFITNPESVGKVSGAISLCPC